MRLYQITHSIIEAQHDEVNIDALEQLELAFIDKAGAIAAVTKNLRAESDAVDAEIKRLQQRKAAIDNNRKRLMDYLQQNMERAGLSKIENGVHQIRLQKSPLSIEVIDRDSVPEQFRVVKIEHSVDKKAIAEHLKETGEIPDGVNAHHNFHLRIS